MNGSMAGAVLLDTHVLVWLVAGDTRLSLPARQRIEEAAQRNEAWISAITPWEIGMLVAKDHLALTQDAQQWMEQVLALPGLRLAPLEPAIAVASSRLPGTPHGDPADRIIVATARHHGATLITADDQLLAYGMAGHVKVLSAV